MPEVTAQLGFHEMLRRRAKAAPEAPALLAPDRAPLLYADLLRQVEHVAAMLRAFAIQPGDRVAVVLPNGPEMAACFLAVGAVAACAPLNPSYRSAEFDFYLRDLHAKVLIVQAGFDSPARAVAAEHGIRVIELIPQTAAGAGTFILASDRQPDRAEPFGAGTDTALVLHTSGTTARPKMVALTHANLCASARNIADWLELGPNDRCLNVMPLFHIHGLVGAALATIESGGGVVCTPGFQAPRFFEWLEAFQPSWYTAVPTIHQAVLARAAQGGGRGIASSLRFIRSSSAPLPPQVMTGLEELFDVPVLEAYGMTEAAHQMTCNPLPPGPRKKASVGLPAGPRIAVMDDAGQILGPSTEGEIAIRGENVFSGYVTNDEANAKAFTDGWFRTGDLGHFDEGGYLFIKGRLKEIINRGGEKVSPREVEEVLMDHPAVAEAMAFAMPDPRLGEEVAAAVVLRPDTAVAERALRDFAAGRLADFKLPRRIAFLDQMPKGATGKPQRLGMAQTLGFAASEREPAPFLAPRSATELLLAHIWSRILQLNTVSITQDFFAAGGDSLSAIEMITLAEKTAGTQLSVTDLFEAPTIETLAALIDAGPGGRKPQRLFAIQPDGTRPPFFCIGAGPLMRELALRIGAQQPFLSPLCYDYSWLPDPCRIEDIAAFHVETIRTARPEGPYFLGGWCIDGVVAWEVARQLRDKGQQVGLLVLFDTVNAAAASRGLRRAAAWVGSRVKRLNSVDAAQVPSYILQGVHALAGKVRRRARAMHYDLRLRMRMKVDKVLADALAIQHWANEHYQPGALDCPILLIHRSLQQGPSYVDRAFGWAGLATGRLEVREIPGDHRAMFLEPHVAETASLLCERLEAAQAI